jgi:hypothetical protein
MTWHVNGGALHLRRADGCTVAVDELAAGLLALAAALDAVDTSDTDERAVGMLWQLSADVGDLVDLAGALGVLERER